MAQQNGSADPRVAEGIKFRIEALGQTPLEAVQKADRLVRNLLRDWPTDWPIEFTGAYWFIGEAQWTATLEGYARDDSQDGSSAPRSGADSGGHG